MVVLRTATLRQDQDPDQDPLRDGQDMADTDANPSPLPNSDANPSPLPIHCGQSMAGSDATPPLSSGLDDDNIDLISPVRPPTPTPPRVRPSSPSPPPVRLSSSTTPPISADERAGPVGVKHGARRRAGAGGRKGASPSRPRRQPCSRPSDGRLAPYSCCEVDSCALNLSQRALPSPSSARHLTIRD